jgi:hypothetical protein
MDGKIEHNSFLSSVGSVGGYFVLQLNSFDGSVGADKNNNHHRRHQHHNSLLEIVQKFLIA